MDFALVLEIFFWGVPLGRVRGLAVVRARACARAWAGSIPLALSRGLRGYLSCLRALSRGLRDRTTTNGTFNQELAG